MIRDKINEIISERILILDGAMGSMISVYGLSEDDFRGVRFHDHGKPLKGCNDLLCLTRPEIIAGIHEAYLEAGADIIETCSLNSSAIGLDEFGLGKYAREISRASAILAREAADKFSAEGRPRFVAGSIGPTAKSASLTRDIDNPGNRLITFDELETSYYENAAGLAEGGCDFMLIETAYDGLNAKAAIAAILRLSGELGRDIPVVVSATVTETGRLITGQSIEQFCEAMLHAKPLALGLNCSFGAEKLLGALEAVSAMVPCPVCFYPNAGLPDAHGHYADTPGIMASLLRSCMKNGLVNIVGGCCGSTPDHIRAISEISVGHKPRAFSRDTNLFFPAKNDFETVPWQKAMDIGDYEGAVEIANAENEKTSGLNMIILSADRAPDPAGTLKNFIFLSSSFSALASLPVLIESADFEVIREAVKCVQGRCFARLYGGARGIQFREKYNELLALGAGLIDIP